MVGLVFLCGGILGLYSISSELWRDVLKSWGDSMAYGGEHLIRHWGGSAVLNLFIGVLSIICGVGMVFQRSQFAQIWIVLIFALWIFLVALTIFPLPYGFQRVDISDIAILSLITFASWKVLKPFHKPQKAK